MSISGPTVSSILNIIGMIGVYGASIFKDLPSGNQCQCLIKGSITPMEKATETGSEISDHNSEVTKEEPIEVIEII